MTEGNITISVQSAPDRSARSDMVARIEPVGDLAGRKSQDIVLPAAGDGTRTVTLEAGLYNLQLFLPTGGIIQQVCEVAGGRDLPVVLNDTASSPSRFSLQEASGTGDLSSLLAQAIRSRPTGPLAMREPIVVVEQEQATPEPVRRQAATRKVTAARKPSGVRASPRSGPRVSGAARRVSDAQTARPTTTRASAAARPYQPALWLAPSELLSGRNAWARLAVADDAWLRPTSTGVDQAPRQALAGAAVWRIDGSLAERDGQTRRLWAVVLAEAGYEVVSLPAPWRSARDWTVSPVDILSDATIKGRAGTSVAVHDQLMDGLLSYLDQGRIYTVRPLVEELDQAGLIEHVIMEKARNPLAACAAAYVGLALFDPWEQERWDSWLPNIMNRFPWIPDGAIVHARRIMLRPRDPNEAASVLAAVTSAFDAGIPYYSAGLQLLRDMLERLAVTHDEARRMLEAVSPIAARADPRQLFTTLRFPLAVKRRR